MAESTALTLGVPPGDYTCRLWIPGRDAGLVELPGELSLEAERPCRWHPVGRPVWMPPGCGFTSDLRRPVWSSGFPSDELRQVLDRVLAHTVSFRAAAEDAPQVPSVGFLQALARFYAPTPE